MKQEKSPKDTGISEITGKTVRIRHATEGDMPFIEQSLKEHKLSTVDLDYREFVVADEESQIIGFGRLRQKCGICDIGCIVLIEEKKKQKIGSVIVRHLIAYAPVNRVYVMTDRVDFFSGLGFIKVKEGAKEYFDALGAAGFECTGEGKRKPELMVYEKSGK